MVYTCWIYKTQKKILPTIVIIVSPPDKTFLSDISNVLKLQSTPTCHIYYP